MDEGQPEVNKTTENTKECEEGKKIIKRYEEVLKTERKKEIINILRKQGQLLERFKEKNSFFRDQV